jgi:hypothetical protein
MLFFVVMAGPLESYVWSELFDEVVDRHHRSYVSAVLGRSPGNKRFRTTRTLIRYTRSGFRST